MEGKDSQAFLEHLSPWFQQIPKAQLIHAFWVSCSPLYSSKWPGMLKPAHDFPCMGAME